MRIRFAAFVAGLGLIVGVLPVAAHHSFNAEYDVQKPITLKGAVTKVEWKNPHTYFYIDVKDETGKITNWGLEMGSPNALMRAGWSRNSMKVGDEVVVEASRAKDGSELGNVKAVTLGRTGQRLFGASSGDPAETPVR